MSVFDNAANIGKALGGTISQVAGAANRIGNLLGLGNTADHPPQLKLGDFVFADTEIPEALPIASAQQLTVHQLPGGARVVDAMGTVWAPISWSGLLLGSQAFDRANTLGLMRDSGKMQVLSFSHLRVPVIISELALNFERTYQIPYTITCIQVTETGLPSESADADAAIQADADNSNNLAALLGISSITSSVNTAMGYVKDINQFSKATIAQVKTALDAVKIARSSVQSVTKSIENTMRTLTSLGGVAPNASITSNRTALAGHVTNTQNVAALHQLDQTLSRMQTNINMAAGLGGPGNTQRTVTVIGGNLMTIAQKYYGDAQQWQLIAQANHLTDPIITGQKTLILPPLNR